jgi:GMP synthase (glutamine-hydrolysing)
VRVTDSLKTSPVLVVDYGAQYAQLIARRVREAKIYSEVVPHTMSVADILAKDPAAVILSGGPSSVYADDAPGLDVALLEAGVPVFGMCYGFQAMVKALGGTVERTGLREYGSTRAQVSDRESTLFNGQPAEQSVWMSHGDSVTEAPDGMRVTASTTGAPVAAFEDDERRLYGVQWHPEVLHSTFGQPVLENFLVRGAGITPDWTADNVIDEQVALIKETVGQDRVLCALSGGVDSSVAAALVQRAVGDQLTCVFVDHGLLRQGEAEQVEQEFAAATGVNLVVVDAKERFLGALAGVTDPEEKRKIIGREFINVFQAEAAKLPNAKWLAQGTIYPDVIESAASKTGKAVAIKSHHNVGGLPETLNLKLLEPLRELFKDEVRKLGIALGLPPAMVYRHPFPGPGLGVRILGEVKAEYAELLRRADAIFIEELRNATDPASGKSWYDLTSQAFAVFLPVKSVGVMGDGRTYDYVVALRAVQTSDFMTADWAELPYSLLKKVSSRVINEIRGINRVTYDVSSKPPATIEWE